MNKPTVSLVMTVNNRPADVSAAVAESFRLPGNEVDQVVIVLDRPTKEASDGVEAAWSIEAGKVDLAFVHGEPGWLGPARAWNAGFKVAKGDLLYCISSEVVQEPANVATAVSMSTNMDTVVFGACHNSIPENLVVGAEPGLLVNSVMPRPLGFIACFPRKNALHIGGFDEKFMDGFWFDDDDFYLRLWRSGLDFVWDDRIHGTHIHHERPDLNTPEGQAKIQTNARYMLAKHSTQHPWPNLPKIVSYRPGRTEWSHV